MLADMFIELQAARLLVYKTATRLDQGEEAREDAYVAKYFADEMAFKTADHCMQIHGGIAHDRSSDREDVAAAAQLSHYRRRERGHEDGHCPSRAQNLRVRKCHDQGATHCACDVRNARTWSSWIRCSTRSSAISIRGHGIPTARSGRRSGPGTTGRSPAGSATDAGLSLEPR